MTGMIQEGDDVPVDRLWGRGLAPQRGTHARRISAHALRTPTRALPASAHALRASAHALRASAHALRASTDAPTGIDACALPGETHPIVRATAIVHPSGRITPTTLTLDAQGTPWSARHGDVYHSRAGGFEQARAVFLAGNGLPGRWAGLRQFTIVETGFGLGTNFLATWRAWRADPARPGRLDMVSIEASPFSADDLLKWHAEGTEGHDQALALARAWPMPLAGIHRLEFEEGRVVLTLVLGEFSAAAARLRLRADAFFLDGFAPSRNPDGWSLPLIRALARIAAGPEGPAGSATAATYTTARQVVDHLTQAGFEVRRAPGFGGKRERLEACFAPRYVVRRRGPPPAPVWPRRDAIVVGAGIAGLACADRLAARGWRVTLVDAGSAPLAGASGLPLGAFHPVIARDESRLARFTRAGFLWQEVHASAVARIACGHLDLATDDAVAAAEAATMDALAFPPGFARWVDAGEASDRVGQPMPRGGVFYPTAGCIRPSEWCRDILQRHAAALTFIGSVEARRLDRVNGGWLLSDAKGRSIAVAPVVVIATGAGLAAGDAMTEGAPCLGEGGSLGLQVEPVRGQLTALAARGDVASLRAPDTAVGGDGHCLPAVDGQVWVGATYARENASLSPRLADDEANRHRLDRLLPQAGASGARILDRFVGFRAVAADRMPLAGAVPDLDRLAADPAAWRGAHLPDLPRQEGLFACTAMASRGLTWAGIAAETVASLIEGEPLPIESDLADAIDPARRVLDQLRRGQFARGR